MRSEDEVWRKKGCFHMSTYGCMYTDLLGVEMVQLDNAMLAGIVLLLSSSVCFNMRFSSAVMGSFRAKAPSSGSTPPAYICPGSFTLC